MGDVKSLCRVARCAARVRPLWILWLLAALTLGAPASAQERFSLYVPSPQSVAEAMAKIANVGKNDVVVDLGSGDGRIVTTAARLYGARGFGVDINPELVELANALAKKSGVGDRVSFRHQNVFDADLKGVTVVNLYLFPELMRMLRPKFLNELQPGARIVSHDFNMGTWEPDEQITAEVIETELESEHSTDALETRGGFVSSERDARGCQHLPRSGERCEEAGAGEEICALAKKKLATQRVRDALVEDEHGSAR